MKPIKFIFLLLFAMPVLAEPYVSSTLPPAPLMWDAECTQPVEGFSKSNRLSTAQDKLRDDDSLFDGDYFLCSVARLTKTGNPETSTPIPPEPPATNIPFGDVPALQAIGLLPKYTLARTISPDTSIDWFNTTGERGEIGLIPEQHAAFLAGQTDLLDSILSAALTPAPPGVSHSHKPNLFWLPYLMTANVQYVRNMEAVDMQHNAWHQRPVGAGLDWKDSGRELAWSLRDLSQLAYLQGEGVTEKSHYIDAFQKSLERYSNIANGGGFAYLQTYRVLEVQNVSTWDNTSWTSWMESFVGQVLSQIVLMGYTEWMPVADWHFQNLVRRSGSEWPFKAVDGDHVNFNDHLPGATDKDSLRALMDSSTWQSVVEYTASRYDLPEYQALPDNQLIPTGNIGGKVFTYRNRAQYAYGWAALAAKAGVAGAVEKRDQIYSQILVRGDAWDNKNSFVGGISTIDPPIEPPITWTGWDSLPANTFVKVPAMAGVAAITTLLDDAGFSSAKYKGTVKGTFVAWVGAAIDGSNMYIPWGGGHADSSLNGIWKLDLEAMVWSIESMPSDPYAPGMEWSSAYLLSGNYTGYQPHEMGGAADILPDGMPTARHQYGGVWYDSKRNTINQSRASWWRYSINTNKTDRISWKNDDGSLLSPTINHALFYDEVKDKIFGGWKNNDSDYFRFVRVNPNTGVITSIGTPITNATATYCRGGRIIYEFASPKSGEQWAEFNMDSETWVSGNTTGVPEYDYRQEMQGCVYIPEWGKILRQFTKGSLYGKFYLFDVATKENTPFTPVGELLVQDKIGNKMFYYAARNAVIYAGDSGVYVMRVE